MTEIEITEYELKELKRTCDRALWIIESILEDPHLFVLYLQSGKDVDDIKAAVRDLERAVTSLTELKLAAHKAIKELEKQESLTVTKSEGGE